MRAKTLNGGAVELGPQLVETFASNLQGPVLTPDDPGCEESRTVWNGMIDRRPAFVVRCLGVADVIACVDFALECDILLCFKGGGHDIGGLATADGAMVLELSVTWGGWVHPEPRVAHAQAGCLLGDVDRATQLHGLAAVLVFVSMTGIAGLTLGGGFGYVTRRWGYTVDNVLGMDVVTAEGRVGPASEDENEDLFWGLRGGGGNFGVVTGIDYALYPVGPEVVGGLVAWAASEAPAVLDFYRTFFEAAPRELTLVTLVRIAPPAPWLPSEMYGKPIVGILACYSGNPAEGERVVDQGVGEPGR